MNLFRTISTRFITSTSRKLNPTTCLVGNRFSDVRLYNTAATEEQVKKPPPKSLSAPTEKVVEIVNELSDLTLLEVSDLTELLQKKLNITEMPAMAMMMPGMGFSLKGGGVGGGGKSGAKVEEEKKEKTAYDLKLDGFDAAAKIKIIKEVRTFTDLGLKEAKELVEKAPVVLKRGVTKEDAEKIIAKMKEVGAKVSME